MFDRINNYVNDNEFRFVIYEDKIHIINFRKIISLEDSYISILSSNKKIIFKGTNFKLNKLLEREMVITGKINQIEVSDD